MAPADPVWSNAPLLRILNCLVFVDCALDPGNSLVNRRSMSRWEYLDHLWSYKNDRKADRGNSKDGELQKSVNPSLHTAQLDQKDVVTEIEKVEIAVYSAFLCCVSI
jgi:hypothetical protein